MPPSIVGLLRLLVATLSVLCCWGWQPACATETLSLAEVRGNVALGLNASYLRESGSGSLTLAEAQAAWTAGRFERSSLSIPAFGIGSRPVWLRLAIENPQARPSARQLSIETPWLDNVDVYFVHGSQVIHHALGDRFPYAARESDTRLLSVRHDFPAGLTEIYLRTATPDPIVLPIYLATLEEGRLRERQYGYGYGLLYGYLFALLAYNLVLSASLRTRSHLLYATLIASFLALNLAYTGHAFALFWPDALEFQQWIIPVLMVTYANTGLAFTRDFLEMRQRTPLAWRAIGRIQLATYAAVLALTLFSQDQRYSLLLAFGYVAVVAIVTPMMGLAALRSHMPASRYFLIGTLATMMGMLITALCVWGVIPYTQFRFHAAEFGMLIDATLLALALGYRFRTIQSERAAAQQLAARDPLTNLYNRRAFLELLEGHWERGQRLKRRISLVMLDLDHFKAINDQYGHALGDTALTNTANALARTVRSGDLIARWGGEEFLIALPETGLPEACVLAERLRVAIESIRLEHKGERVKLSASLGIVTQSEHESIDALLRDVDAQLYNAKSAGRNCIFPPKLGFSLE